MPVKNRQYFAKPEGGLWGSPVGSHHSWEAWCQREEFRVHKLRESFTFWIDGNIFVVDTPEDLNRMPYVPYTDFDYIGNPDFEKMFSDGIDAVYLTEQGEYSTRFSLPRTLYGWDCESVLVMNPRCIII